MSLQSLKESYLGTHLDLSQHSDPERIGVLTYHDVSPYLVWTRSGLVSGIPVGSYSRCSYVMNHLSINRHMWANEKSAEWRHCEVRKPGA